MNDYIILLYIYYISFNLDMNIERELPWHAYSNTLLIKNCFPNPLNPPKTSPSYTYLPSFTHNQASELYLQSTNVLQEVPMFSLAKNLLTKDLTKCLISPQLQWGAS